MQKISLKEFFGYNNRVQLIFENSNISTFLIEIDESAKSILEFTMNKDHCYVEIKNNITENSECNEDCKRKKKKEIAKETYKTIKEFIDNHGELSHMTVGMSNPDDDDKYPMVRIMHKMIKRRPIGECNCKFEDNELQLELNTTATAGGEYSTPYAFTNKKKKGKPKDYTYVENINENNIEDILKSYNDMYNKITGK